MAKVLNPTPNCVVDTNVNGNLYKINPGETISVRDEDVEDLCKLLQFLIVEKEVVNEDGKKEKTGEKITVDPTGNIETKQVDIKSEEAFHKAKAAKIFKCTEDMLVINPLTGKKTKKIKCTFETTSKRTLLAHIKEEHQKDTNVKMVKEKDDEF